MLAKFLFNVNPREAICTGTVTFPQMLAPGEMELFSPVFKHLTIELLNALAISILEHYASKI